MSNCERKEGQIIRSILQWLLLALLISLVLRHLVELSLVVLVGVLKGEGGPKRKQISRKMAKSLLLPSRV